MRVFVAIDLPDNVRDALADVQNDLPVGRAMAAETFHLTLSFLDEQPRHVVSSVDRNLAEIRFDPFPLCLRGLDTFGGKRPKLLWVGVAAAPALRALRDKVQRAAVRAGLDMPRTRFRPHVTLARFHGNMRGDAFSRLSGFMAHHGGFATQEFTVDRFVLFRSILSADGAVHQQLATYPAICCG